MSVSDHLAVAREALNQTLLELGQMTEANEAWEGLQEIRRLHADLRIVESSYVYHLKKLIEKAGRPLVVDGGVVKVRPLMRNRWTGRGLLEQRVLDACTLSEDGEVVGDRETAETVIKVMSELYVTPSVAPRRGAVEMLGLKIENIREQEHVGDEIDFLEDKTKHWRQRRRNAK